MGEKRARPSPRLINQVNQACSRPSSPAMEPHRGRLHRLVLDLRRLLPLRHSAPIHTLTQRQGRRIRKLWPLSPMMQQYLEHQGAVPGRDSLLSALGDFYEMFFDDAELVSRELELTLTGKDCGLSERAPMCGVPFHAVDAYRGPADRKGLQGGHLRADGGSRAGQGPGRAGGDARRHARARSSNRPCSTSAGPATSSAHIAVQKDKAGVGVLRRVHRRILPVPVRRREEPPGATSWPRGRRASCW